MFLSPIYHSWWTNRIVQKPSGVPQNLVFSPRPQRFHFFISVPFPFLLTFSSYCVCSSFVVRAVLNFSMNGMARSAELLATARTWSLVWPALECDSPSQVEAGCWTKVSIIPSAGKIYFFLEVTKSSFLWRSQWWFPLQARQTFAQRQLGIGFSRILCFFFLFEECQTVQNLTEVPEVLFHGHLYLLGDINNNDIILHCLHCFYVLQWLNIYMLFMLCSSRTTPIFT